MLRLALESRSETGPDLPSGSICVREGNGWESCPQGETQNKKVLGLTLQVIDPLTKSV